LIGAALGAAIWAVYSAAKQGIQVAVAILSHIASRARERHCRPAENGQPEAP